MASCCGRGSKKAKAAKPKNGPLVYDTTAHPVGGRCPIDGLNGLYQKRWSNGTRIRVFNCAGGHVCPV